jgi:hypothetical protein
VSGPWDDPKIDFIKIFDDTRTVSKELEQESLPAGGPLIKTLDPNTYTAPDDTVSVALDSNEPAVQGDSD